MASLLNTYKVYTYDEFRNAKSNKRQLKYGMLKGRVISLTLFNVKTANPIFSRHVTHGNTSKQHKTSHFELPRVVTRWKKLAIYTSKPKSFQCRHTKDYWYHVVSPIMPATMLWSVNVFKKKFASNGCQHIGGRGLKTNNTRIQLTHTTIVNDTVNKVLGKLHHRSQMKKGSCPGTINLIWLVGSSGELG